MIHVLVFNSLLYYLLKLWAVIHYYYFLLLFLCVCLIGFAVVVCFVCLFIACLFGCFLVIVCFHFAVN